VGFTLQGTASDNEMMKRKWNLISIQIKILNDIECNFNWIEVQLILVQIQLNSYSIQLNPNTMNGIEFQFQFNKIQLDSNSIEKKWDVNFYKRYWKFAPISISIVCDYDVEKISKSKKTPFHSTYNKFKTKIYFGKMKLI